MFKKVTNALGGDPQKRELERLSAIAERINALEPDFASLSAADLLAKSAAFRERLSNGETLDDILPEAFAAVREASKRTLGLRHFDVQLIGGVVMHEGNIAEMRTGEGKTLAATLPLYLNTLTDKGTHLVTVNDYLARRDARWMAPIYFALGMSVGVLQMASQTDHGRSAFLIDFEVSSNREEQHHLRMVPRSEAYAADITYGTNNEFGFDYLRDNLVQRISDRVQRGHHFAIVDEVDNILIDEARTPLIISGPASEDVALYQQIAQVVKQINPEDYDFSEKDRSVALTEIGETHVEEILKMPLRDPERPEDITPEQARILGHLEQALRAELLFKKNKDYIVQGGQVVIVDEFTGRLMPGRRWSEGLHQAVEAKEGVKVNPENITHATITLQNYFRMYEKLAGMTGTALTEAEEFGTIYNLGVLPIPTNLDYIALQPSTTLQTLQAKDDEGYTFDYYVDKNDVEKSPLFWKRKDFPDVVYRTLEGKLRAITFEIIHYHVIGRPQLVGTTSIEHSEHLSQRLNTEYIRRLMQIQLITHQWRKTHAIKSVEQAIPELEKLNQPLSKLQSTDLRSLLQEAGLASLNPEEPDNVSLLIEVLELHESDRERLLKVINGGIPHQVLNALRHDTESQIIAGAGAFGAVTIATNMAGRGVDIKLGGELEEQILADIMHVLRSNQIDPYQFSYQQMEDALQNIPASQYGVYEESVSAFLEFMKNMRAVRERGGLHVIGSERHEARRIDNQLRGRAARQGDPGSSRFYLSLEDDLMRLFGGERAESMMKFFNIDVSLPIESKLIGRMVEQAQERVEGYNFDVRKHLLEYDDVLNDQRKRIYAERDKVMMKTDLSEDVQEMVLTEMEGRIHTALAEPEGSWKLMAFLEEIQPSMFYPQYAIFLPSFTLKTVAETLLLDLHEKKATPELIEAALVDVAKDAILAEKAHLLATFTEFIERTEKSFLEQYQERVEQVSTFLDGATFEENQQMDTRQFLQELNRYAGFNLNLNTQDIHLLLAGNREIFEKIKARINEELKQIFVKRIRFTLERRIGENVSIDSEELTSLTWKEMNNKYLQVLKAMFDNKIQELLNGQGQLARNVEEILKQTWEEIRLENIMQWLSMLATGTRIAIDSRTHQRGLQRVSLLNYVFLAAENLKRMSAEQISQQILQHLENIRLLQAQAWGKMELERMQDPESRLMYLNPEVLQRLSSAVEQDQYQELIQKNFRDLKEEENRLVVNVVGQHMQNAIHRHILLGAVTELWSENLTRMEALRVSIRMEAYAQRDPLVQYKSESSDAFKQLLADIRLAVISRIFRIQPIQQKPEAEAVAAPSNALPSSPAQANQAKSKKRKRHKKR